MAPRNSIIPGWEWLAGYTCVSDCICMWVIFNMMVFGQSELGSNAYPILFNFIQFYLFVNLLQERKVEMQLSICLRRSHEMDILYKYPEIFTFSLLRWYFITQTKAK